MNTSLSGTGKTDELSGCNPKANAEATSVKSTMKRIVITFPILYDAGGFEKINATY